MKSLVWFRRDLRLHDNAALSYATHNSEEVYGVFVFDDNILLKLRDKRDHRVTFIYETLKAMNEKLAAKNASLYLLKGDPVKLVPKLAKDLQVDMVCANRDYEKYAKSRDKEVNEKLEEKGIEFWSFKDQVVFESDEIRTQEGSFYKVFTPYSRAWLRQKYAAEDAVSERPVDLSKMAYRELKGCGRELSLKDIGFVETEERRKRDVNGRKRLKSFLKNVNEYKEKRDLPAEDGTSRISVYLRFGNLSVRECVRALGDLDSEGKKAWLNELIWRDFYSGFLDKNNNIENASYKYGSLSWSRSEKNFEAWKRGETGVPIVDAGMRQMNQIGWMHNRVRMIVGSYLTKILLIDWRKGERYFGEKLIDYDLASNNGGWQWCASTGTDSVPYFRIFNPYTQAEKYDKEAKYIKKFCPELKDLPPKYCHNPTLMDEKAEEKYNFKLGKNYPAPIADYKKGREKALQTFKEAANG